MERRYFNPIIEKMPRSELKEYQWRKLKQQLNHIWQSNPYYRKRMENAGIKGPDDIKTPADFRQLPVTRKKDLVEDQAACPPFGERLGISQEKIGLVITTSGTSGMGQEVHSLSMADKEWMGRDWAASFYRMGVNQGDVVCHFLPLTILAAAWGINGGIEQVGGRVLALSPFDTAQRIERMRQFQPKFMMNVPPYLTTLTLEVQKMGLDPKKDFSFRAIGLGAMGYPEAWGQRIAETWGARLHEHYSSSQLLAGAAHTCERGAFWNGKRGLMHIQENYVYAEIINPETGEPAKEGEAGEFILTSLNREAAPLLRFATADKVVYFPALACDCERPFDCIQAGTIERYDDMIKMKAMNVWPAAVDGVMFSHPEIEEYVGRVFVDQSGRERVGIKVEFKAGCSEQLRRHLITRMILQLRERTGVSMEIEEAPSGSLPRWDFKAKRWTDERAKGLKEAKF